VYQYTPSDLQTVQNYEDKTNEAIMVMQANIQVLTSLRKFYQALLKNKHFPLEKACSGDVAAFATQINDMIYDTEMNISRAQLLIRITGDRKSLVSRARASSFNSDIFIYSLHMCANTGTGLAAPSKPSDAENGGLDYKYGQDWCPIPERGNRHANNNRSNLTLSTSNLCIRKYPTPIRHFTTNRIRPSSAQMS
jgi:hypothetical protein